MDRYRFTFLVGIASLVLAFLYLPIVGQAEESGLETVTWQKNVLFSLMSIYLIGGIYLWYTGFKRHRKFLRNPIKKLLYVVFLAFSGYFMEFLHRNHAGTSS